MEESIRNLKEVIEKMELCSKHIGEYCTLSTIADCVYEMRKLVESGKAPSGFAYTVEELEEAEEYSMKQVCAYW